MKFLFTRSRNDDAERDVRRAIEARRASGTRRDGLSPFGSPLNALKPLIS